MTSPNRVAPTAADMLTRDFLDWLARSPRTYAEAMDAWRSSCPRLTIWEDALAAGYVEVGATRGAPMGSAPVVLTDRGKALVGSESDLEPMRGK